jgi:hypothetical protein
VGAKRARPAAWPDGVLSFSSPASYAASMGRMICLVFLCARREFATIFSKTTGNICQILKGSYAFR